MKYIHSCIIAFFLASWSSHGMIDSSLEKKIFEKCESAASRVNALLGKRGITPEVELNPNSPIKFVESRQYKTKVYKVGSGRSSCQFRLLPESFDIVYFSNQQVNVVAYGEGSQTYEEPPRAKLSKDQAGQFAKEYIEALLGGIPNNVKLYEARFMHPYRKDKKYRDGEWFVSFRRVNRNGNLFMNDAITVLLNENYGPTTVGIVLASQYEETDFEPISQDEAEQKAIIGAKQILSWQPAKMGGWFESHQLNKAAISSELWVVNPNYLTQRQSITEAAKQASREARLAWVVKFKATNKQPEAGNHEISVWVDAESGKILGGDFK